MAVGWFQLLSRDSPLRAEIFLTQTPLILGSSASLSAGPPSASGQSGFTHWGAAGFRRLRGVLSGLRRSSSPPLRRSLPPSSDISASSPSSRRNRRSNPASRPSARGGRPSRAGLRPAGRKGNLLPPPPACASIRRCAMRMRNFVGSKVSPTPFSPPPAAGNSASVDTPWSCLRRRRCV